MWRALILVAVACGQSSSGAQIDAKPADGKPADASNACTNADAGVGCGTGKFCNIFLGGVLPLVGYGSCTALPAPCTSTPTCACLMANLTCGAALMCSGAEPDLAAVCVGP